MGEFLMRPEDIFAAVAFADAGEHEKAAQFGSWSAFPPPAAAPMAQGGDS
jgi:hypothetical protein